MISEEQIEAAFELKKLIDSEEYKLLKEKSLEYILDLSKGDFSAERIKGMLILIQYLDSLGEEYSSLILRKKAERGDVDG